MDKGAIAAFLALAKKIDTDARLREKALKFAQESGERPPVVDNVSIPTYLKFCESLGLTPAGRLRMTEKKGGKGGKLAQLRAVTPAGG